MALDGELICESWHNLQMKLLGNISRAEVIAEGRGIREWARLVEQYGGRNWKNARESRWSRHSKLRLSRKFIGKNAMASAQ